MPLSEEFESVWDAIEDDKGEAEAMKIRSMLMAIILENVRSWRVSQKAASEKLGIDLLRSRQLINGEINRFNIDELIVIARRLGINVQIAITKV